MHCHLYNNWAEIEIIYFTITLQNLSYYTIEFYYPGLTGYSKYLLQDFFYSLMSHQCNNTYRYLASLLGVQRSRVSEHVHLIGLPVFENLLTHSLAYKLRLGFEYRVYCIDLQNWTTMLRKFNYPKYSRVTELSSFLQQLKY